MIFDTHAHYDDHAFDGDREAVLASLAEKGVGSVVDVAASVSSLERVKALADTYDFVYGAVGLHPDEVGAHSREARSGAVFTCTADGVTREEPVRGLTDMVYGRLRELLADPKAPEILRRMEESGGEPDTVGFDKETTDPAGRPPKSPGRKRSGLLLRRNTAPFPAKNGYGGTKRLPGRAAVWLQKESSTPMPIPWNRPAFIPGSVSSSVSAALSRMPIRKNSAK